MKSNISLARKYAYDLALEKKVCYAQLDMDERETLTGLLLDSTPQIHAYEYIADADHRCELPYMLAKLMSSHTSDQYLSLRDDIIELLKINASKSMSSQIDQLLKNAEEDVNFDKKFNKDSNDE